MNKIFFIIFAISLFFQNSYSGSFFSYSTNGKSPGLMELGGSARSMATAHGLLASPNGYVLNSRNFASWSARYTTQFTFSFVSETYFLETKDDKVEWASFAFDDVALNIPIIKNEWAFGFGFSPLSSSEIGFSVESDIGEVIQRYRSSFLADYVRLSFAPSENWRVATTFLYTFGNLSDEFKVLTIDELYINNFNAIHEYQARVPNLGLSFQYDDSTLQFSGQVVIPFKGQMFHVENSPGSITPEEVFDMTMPYRFSGGMGLTFDYFRIGISGIYENWEEGFTVADNNYPQDLADVVYLGLGFETKSNKSSFALGSDNIAWRFGLHGAILNNRDNFSVIKEYAIHTGIGIPFNSNFSNIDIGIEVGSRGDIEINLANELYVKVGLSFTTGEPWFVALDN